MSVRVAVITGTAGGVGAATASAFLRNGWAVHGIDRRKSSVAEVISHACDVTYFLASGRASYVSGAIIPVDGGALAHGAGISFPKRRPR